MSFGTASVDVELDAKRAVQQLQGLLQTIASSTASVGLTVDVSGIRPEIEGAVDAADSELDVTADARRVTGSIDSSVDAADSQIEVTGDATQVTGEIDGSIDAADSEITITGDASQVTGEVSSAVDAADSEITVTGDASQVTGAVTSAVDAADNTVIIVGDASDVVGTIDAALAEASPFGPVNVSGRVDPNLLTDVGNLAANIADASDEGRAFTAVLAGLSIAAAAAGLFSLVDAASEAEQSVGAVSAIFGTASGTIDAFAETSAEAAGLTATAARNMTSQIGALLQGFGFTQEEAAKTSVVLAQLGADLAATFGGTPEDAVLALGAALRGEFDPLERFGVSLNITQANLKAVELGLADSTSNVDLNARAQASLALIMERSAGAQGQFQRELNTTAGQLAVARASAAEAAVEVGETLAPTFVELLGIVTDQLLPALTDLGTELGPALASAASASVPVLGGAVSLLVSLTPVVEALGSAVEAIPEPVLQVVGTLLALRAAAGPLGSVVNQGIRALSGLGVAATLNVSSLGLLRGTLATARDGVSTLASSISPLTVVLGIAAFAFTTYAQAQAEARKRAAEVEAQNDSLGEALRSTEGAVDGLVARLNEMVEAGDKLEFGFKPLEELLPEIGDALGDAGLTTEQFADAVADTDQPLDRLIKQLVDEGGEAELAAGTLGELEARTQDQARAAIEAGVATDQWTDAQRDAALATAENRDGSTNYVAALDSLSAAHLESEQAAEAQAEALTEQQKVLQELAVSTPQVTFLMAALGSESNRTSDLLGALAISAADAGLSEQEMQAILAQLGATGPQAVASLQAVADTIDRVRTAGLNTLPSIQDFAGEFDKFSLQGFRDDLAEGLEAIRNFNANLVVIAEQGGPRLAAAAAELGPQFAAEIANGIKNGQPGVATQVELLLAAVEGAGADTEALLTNQIGPDLAVATGQMGTLATDAFGNNFVLDPSGQIVQLESTLIGGRPGVAFRAAELGTSGTSGYDAGLDLTTPTSTAIEGVDDTITASGPGVATRAAELGTTATSGFESGFTPSTPASSRITEARLRIRNAKEGIRGAGSEAGSAGTSGFGSGVSGIPSSGRAAVVEAVNTILRLRDTARSGGRQVGAALGAGVVAGIAAQVANVQAQAAALVAGAVAAAKAAAKIDSPSRVFTEIGSDMGEGVAVGLVASTESAVRASADLVASAAAAADQEIDFTRRRLTLRPLAVAPEDESVVRSAAAAVAGSGTTMTFAEGAFQIRFESVPDRAEAQAVGDVIGNAISDTLNRRLVRVAARTA